jgi:hypothetical protein
MKNLTPQHLRCHFGESCPSVHELEDGRLLIVGEMQFDWWTREKGGNPGQNEMGITIDKALLSTIRDEVREECAKIADEARGKWLDYDEIADAIRALKETPHE